MKILKTYEKFFFNNKYKIKYRVEGNENYYTTVLKASNEKNAEKIFRKKIKNPNIKILNVEETDDNVSENEYRMININYVAMVNDQKNKPIFYITDFKIVRDDGNEVECNVIGYRRLRKKINGVDRVEWFYVNDFKNNRTTKIYKTDFKSGTVRKKIYNL